MVITHTSATVQLSSSKSNDINGDGEGVDETEPLPKKHMQLDGQIVGLPKLSTAFLIGALLIPTKVASAVCYEDDQASFVAATKMGDLSRARSMAQQLYREGCATESELSNAYREKADEFLASDGSIPRVSDHAERLPPRKYEQEHNKNNECWNFEPKEFSLEFWDKCCSTVQSSSDSGSKKKDEVLFNDDPFADGPAVGVCVRFGRPLCCGFFYGSSSYLRLPVIRELQLKMTLPIEGRKATTMTLEQDGFLRRFDAAGILWPTGYLLSLCVSAPVQCGISELIDGAVLSSDVPVALELGTGIGAASIALAKQLQIILQRDSPRLVVATDKAVSALALTVANSHAAGVSSLVKVTQLDHYNVSSVQKFKAKHAPSGFAIILGSSLQKLFDGTEAKNHHLWTILDLLLMDKHDGAIILLAHTVNGLEKSDDSLFERIKVISGDTFGMTTRYGESSDFEISVFRRRGKGDQEL